MIPLSNARIAGLLYLVVVVAGLFSLAQAVLAGDDGGLALDDRGEEGLDLLDADGRVPHHEQRAREAERRREREESEIAATRIASTTLTMGVKVGDGGKLYGSITAKDIADALGRRGAGGPGPRGVAVSRDGLFAERMDRVLSSCYNCRTEFNCTEVCPKEISLDFITRLNREYIGAMLHEAVGRTAAREGGTG